MKLKPEIWLKAVKITSRFEGILAGNFDGAYLSFGYLQWNFGSGTLQPLFKRLFKEFPKIAANILPKAGISLNKALVAGTEKQWALSIQTKNVINSEWTKALKNLYNTQAFQKIMSDAAAWYRNKAIKLCTQYSLATDRSFCLFFDIVVQLGSLKQLTISNTDTLSKLKYIATQAALMANKRWQSDVRARKMAIVMSKDMGRGWDTSIKFDDKNAFV